MLETLLDELMAMFTQNYWGCATLCKSPPLAVSLGMDDAMPADFAGRSECDLASTDLFSR